MAKAGSFVDFQNPDVIRFCERGSFYYEIPDVNFNYTKLQDSDFII